MTHARVAPSALSLTVACPGSLQLRESVVPAPPTRDQAEGVLGHLVALKYAQGPDFRKEWPVGRETKVDYHDFTVDDDMVDGALIYSEEAQANGRFEESVSIPDVHESCWGTPDWWRVIMETFLRQLKVIDYKYGHRFVEVFEHYQLVAYAAGVARFLSLPEDFPVVLVIVQPRNYTHGAVREWKTTVGEIYRIVAERIRPRVELALSPNPPTVTGRHCLDCPARHACRTLAVETASLVDFSATAEVQDLPLQAVGQELRILKEAMKRLEARYTGLYEQAYNLGRNGQSIPHWHMEPSKGRLKWKDDTTVQGVADMGALMGVNLLKAPALITPTQAKSAGLDEGVVGEYAHRPPGAMKLVPDDTTVTRKIFGANRT